MRKCVYSTGGTAARGDARDGAVRANEVRVGVGAVLKHVSTGYVMKRRTHRDPLPGATAQVLDDRGAVGVCEIKVRAVVVGGGKCGPGGGGKSVGGGGVGGALGPDDDDVAGAGRCVACARGDAEGGLEAVDVHGGEEVDEGAGKLGGPGAEGAGGGVVELDGSLGGGRVEADGGVVPLCAVLLGGELKPGEGEGVTKQVNATDLSMPGWAARRASESWRMEAWREVETTTEETATLDAIVVVARDRGIGGFALTNALRESSLSSWAGKSDE